MMNKKLMRSIACGLVLSTSQFVLPLPASAALIGTDQIVAPAASQEAERDKVRDFLNRADAQAQLQRLGVDPRDAQARVEAMTDEEVQRVASRIDQLPAAGADVLGVLLVVFVVLLLTDILGFTKVFPFTRPIK